MTPIMLQQIVDCTGGSLRSDEFEPATNPILTLTLKAQDGQIYLLPLSEQGAARLWAAISNWRQARDFLSQQEPPEPSRRQ